MPTLSRARIVSIGHSNARIRDLTLDFRNENNLAAPAVVRLRNGGGKTSLVSYILSLICPDRRDFLAARGEGGRARHLEDYVQTKDHSLVVLEWELDRSPAEEPQYLVTGAFYEWRNQDLRRFYFSARVAADVAQLTLDGLPIAAPSGDRYTLSSFRQEWNDLRAKHPEREVNHTESQTEWAQILDQAGIDPELFHYQVRMNHREGGADSIFRFNSSLEFVDFLLDLAAKTDLADKVTENISKFRSSLKERLHQLEPEKKLLTALKEKLGPLQETWSTRQNVYRDAAQLHDELKHLQEHVAQRQNSLQKSIDQADADATTAFTDATSKANAALELRRTSWSLRRFAADSRVATLATEQEETKKRSERAQRNHALLIAGAPLAHAWKHENRARRYADDLKAKQVDARPLLEALQRVAIDFYAALQQDVDLLRAKEKELHESAAALRSAARAKAQEAAEAKTQAATLRVETRGLREKIAQAGQNHQRFITDGILNIGETIEDSLKRHAQLIANAEATIGELETELKKLAIEEGRDRDELLKLRKNATLAEARLQQYGADLAKADAAHGLLQSNATLRRILEVPSFDPDTLSDASTAQLDNAISECTDRLIKAQLDEISEIRTLRHLRQTQRLPPTPEAEAILQFLQERLPGVASGWLAMDAIAAPNDIEARRRFVTAAPHIAMGIVVRDADFEKAKHLLADLTLTPDTPVAIAPQSVLLESRDGPFFVLGPRTNAHFDIQAGQEELGKLDKQQTERASKIRELRNERGDLEKTKTQLSVFRENYPAGYFARQRELMRGAAEEQAGLDRKVADTNTHLATTSGRITTTRQSRDDTSSSRSHLQSRAEELGRFQTQYGQHLIEWTDTVQANEAAITTFNETRARLDQESTQLDADALTSSQKGGVVGQQAAVAETELNRIDYLPEVKPLATPGPTNTLRSTYTDARVMYETKVDAEGIQQLIKSENHDAQQRRERARALLRNFTLADVEDHLRQLPDPDPATVEQLALQADHDAHELRSGLGRISMAIGKHQDELGAVLEESKETGPLVDPTETPASPEDADQQAKVARTHAETQDAESKRLHLLARTHTEHAERFRSQKTVLEAEAATVVSAQDGVKEILDRDFSLTPLPWLAPETDEVIRIRREAANKRLGQLRVDKRRLDADRTKHFGEVRRVAEHKEFAPLENKIAQQLPRYSEADLEERVPHLIGELTTRINIIDGLIASADKHRNILVNEVLGLAEDGLQILRDATNQSHIPRNVPQFAGAQFLKITTSEPDDTATQRDRIGQLIDDLTKDPNIPAGPDLIKRAVRQLGHPITVRILFPDPTGGLRWVNIEELGKSSGGERITSAILLYCTLAQVRSRQRGRTRPRTTCILDNPLGSASRRKFVELQLAVAQALNVQLIYTTGILDEEAIAPFPRIIQLKNDVVDRNSGHNFVELQSTDLEAVNLGKTADVVTVKNVR